MGKIGKVEKVRVTTQGLIAEGTGIDGKIWKAHNPRLLHKSYDPTMDRLAKSGAAKLAEHNAAKAIRDPNEFTKANNS